MTRKEFSMWAKESFVKGIFWSMGVTIGFAIVSSIVVVILSRINTLPVIGNFVANVVQQTEKNLENR